MSGLAPDVAWRSPNTETIRSLVARGLGFSLLTTRPAGDISYEGLPLRYLPISNEIHHTNVVVALPDGVSETALVTELIAASQRLFAGVSLGIGVPEEDDW